MLYDNEGNKLSEGQAKFFENSEVVDENSNLLLCYHSTTVKLAGNVFKRKINWFTDDILYASQFGSWTEDRETITYECYLNCENLFDVGNTNNRVYEMLPATEPFKFKPWIKSIISRLEMSEEDFRDMVRKASYSEGRSENGYDCRLHTLVRSDIFADRVKSLGYDCIKAVEEKSNTFGVLYPNKIKMQNNLNPTNSDKINEDFSISKEEQEALDCIDKAMGQEEVYMWSTYILPNGHFLNPDNYDGWEDYDGDYPVYEHEDFKVFLEENGYESEVWDETVLDEKCIKMNVTYPYILIPGRWTYAQQQAVKEVINNKDEFAYDLDDCLEWAYGNDKNACAKFKNIQEPLYIDTSCGHTIIDLKDMDEYDVVKFVNMGYARGTLTESLSKSQETYFKDSKVRDEHGNLLVCYHGTVNPGFKEFNPRDNKSQFGEYKFGKYNVNFFTTDKKSALSYTNLGYKEDEVYSCYINIVNPFVVNNESASDIKTSFNIKDKRLRTKQIDLFNKIFDRWNSMYYILDEIKYNDDRFRELNKDLRKLNLTLEQTDEENYYNLVLLGNNGVFGHNRPIEYSYSIEELFDDDMYEQLKDDIIGEEDDYYLSTDDVVRYVIALNEDGDSDYDGIIIEDIYDSKEMFSNIGTDIITLESSNQIKLIDNENPTSSNRIDESDYSYIAKQYDASNDKQRQERNLRIRNLNNSDILTEQGREDLIELLEDITSKRHELHCNQDKLFNSSCFENERYYLWLLNVNEYIRLKGLEPIDFSIDLENDLLTDMDYYEGLTDYDDIDEYREVCYAQYEQINKDIEDWLRKFDKAFNTNYAPTGDLRH